MNEDDGVEFFQHILRTRFVEKRHQEYKEDPERSPEKRIHEIPLNMGQGNDAGHGGHARKGGRGAKERGGHGRNALVKGIGARGMQRP